MTWTLTHHGVVMDLQDPQPHMVGLDDIAVHLSRIARFSGATRRFYCVADHSVFVARIVKDLGGDLEMQRAALFHDAHEAYIGDIPTPVKAVLGGEAGKAIELLKHRLDVAIFAAMDIRHDRETALLIKHADAIALANERQVFMPASGPKWPLKALAGKRQPIISKSCDSAAFSFKKHDWNLRAELNETDTYIMSVGASA